jgi:hypothetical protein
VHLHSYCTRCLCMHSKNGWSSFSSSRSAKAIKCLWQSTDGLFSYNNRTPSNWVLNKCKIFGLDIFMCTLVSHDLKSLGAILKDIKWVRGQIIYRCRRKTLISDKMRTHLISSPSGKLSSAIWKGKLILLTFCKAWQRNILQQYLVVWLRYPDLVVSATNCESPCNHKFRSSFDGTAVKLYLYMYLGARLITYK